MADAKVSVPFPGILFLNDSKWVFDESTTVWFPSPFRGSYFSIKKSCMHFVMFDIEFPSPFRGSYFSIHHDTSGSTECREPVSVPFPGILFLNEF